MMATIVLLENLVLELNVALMTVGARAPVSRPVGEVRAGRHVMAGDKPRGGAPLVLRAAPRPASVAAPVPYSYGVHGTATTVY